MNFTVTVEFYNFDTDFRSGSHSDTIIGKNNAIYYAKDCMRAINAQTAIVTDSYTGEVIYENKFGKEWFSV